MSSVTIYTRKYCPYCSRALKLLDDKGVDYLHIDAGVSADKKAEMVERAGGAHTFPQIFIKDIHVGGCDDLFALERAGELDPLLKDV